MIRKTAAQVVVALGLAASPAAAAPSMEVDEVRVPEDETAQLETLTEIARAEAARAPEAPKGAAPRRLSIVLVRVDRDEDAVGCVVRATIRDARGKILGAAQGKAVVETKEDSAEVERAILTAAVHSAVTGATH
jgi:hypothetical protein